MRPFFVLLALISPGFCYGDYTYEIAAALMFQNEARHLKEWIEYHKLVGVEHFYLFNNLSEDDFYSEIEPYLASGEVELFDYPVPTTSQGDYVPLQCQIYNHALSLARGKVKWLALIDADEYLMPIDRPNLNEALKPFEGYGGVYVSWLNFGTSSVEKIPKDRLRIEMLLYNQGRMATLGKSIVRPERVAVCTDPHVMHYAHPYTHTNTDFKWFEQVSIPSKKRIQIFHYYTGDLDHLTNVKFPRRAKWLPGLELSSYIKSMEGLNRQYNPKMLKFVPAVREALGLPRQ